MSCKLGKPGTPVATAINIDNITLQWIPPETGEVKSYKVLYRPANETEFKTVESQGTVVARYVKDLTHGVEYEFKVVATGASGEQAESDISTIKTKEYYDIVLIGKTGQGKSTFGNKLLNLGKVPAPKIRLFEVSSNPVTKRFTQASDKEVTDLGDHFLSVTAKCKLMANDDTDIRVLDVPGFSDSGTLKNEIGKKVSVQDGNLQIVRWIVRAQEQSQLKVRRIVYFLPVRGALEKADGTMQEELRLLYHYFGKGIFDCMVVAATNHPKLKVQKLGFDKEDYESVQSVFRAALKYAIPDETILCPPVVYVGLSDGTDKCTKNIKDAKVLEDSILQLKFNENICARCSVKVVCKNDEKISVILSDGTKVSYPKSTCHPDFVQRYNTAQKFFGGVAHIITLGIGLIVEKASDKESWPGFTNSDEECIQCKKFPGAEGCTQVYTPYGGSKMVDHSNKL